MRSMMRQDRFLIGILAGIGILVVLSIALFFARRGTLEYVAEDTPDGVVRNYIVAVKKGDYDRAFQYLAPVDPAIDKLSFTQTFTNQGSEIASTGVEVGLATIDGDQALVQVTMLHNNGELFGSVYREQQSAELALSGGSWKIKTMPYPYWNFGWSTTPAKPVQ
jgi:hypothetical protein